MLGFQNADHHYEWCGILDGDVRQNKDTLGLEWIATPGVDEARVENKWIMLEAPRSHSKSTEFTVNYSLQSVYKDPNVRIVICGSAQRQSESFLREITNNIENNPNLHEHYGAIKPEQPERWTQSEIIIKRDNLRLKDPTVSATSVGGTVLSKRADKIICDDILSKENTRTAEQRLKIKEWFWQVLIPVLEPGGQLIIVGTAWHRDDLYQELLADAQFDIRFVYDAIVDDKKKLTLWPDRWSYDQLMKLKESMGTQSFNLAYRNTITSSESSPFDIAWLEAARRRGKDRTFLRTFNYANWDLGRIVTTMGADLAISKKDDADAFALSVIGRTANGMKLPLYMGKHYGWSMGQQEQEIVRLNSIFNCQLIMVENNAYQEALVRDLAEHTDLPIKGFTTSAEKFDMDVGVGSMAVEFENDKWILPYSHDDIYTIDMIDEIIQAMLDFPFGHTSDLLMSLWFANTAMREITVAPQRPEVQIQQNSGFWRNKRL